MNKKVRRTARSPWGLQPLQERSSREENKPPAQGDAADLTSKLRDAARRLIESQPAPVEEPEPAGHPMSYDPAADPTMIEVRTPRYWLYTDGTPGAFNPTARTWETLDGFTVSYRKREPQEEGLAFVIFDDPSARLTKPVAEVVSESFAEWRARVVNQGASNTARRFVAGRQIR